MAFRKCIYCPAFKVIQPYQSTCEHRWICDACADPEQRREIRHAIRVSRRVVVCNTVRIYHFGKKNSI